MIPATTIVLALADLQDRGSQGMIEEFRRDRRYLLASDYSAALDPEPSAIDFLNLVREIGAQTLTQAIAKGAEMAQAAEEQAHNLATTAETNANNLRDVGKRTCDDFSAWSADLLQRARGVS